MSDAVIDIEHVHYSVDGKLVLKDIDFSVREGEFVTLAGASGSGKSTLLKIIASMISQTEGVVKYFGQPIESYDPTVYRKEVSYCFQTAVLFGETVQDNLAFPYEIRDKAFDRNAAIAALQRVGLDETYLKKSVHTLSGGEKQRIALIRNLMFTPKVLLLDEVTSALDEENQRIIGKLIREMNEQENITILWVTHNTAEIKAADRVIRLINGVMEENR